MLELDEARYPASEVGSRAGEGTSGAPAGRGAVDPHSAPQPLWKRRPGPLKADSAPRRAAALGVRGSLNQGALRARRHGMVHTRSPDLPNR